MYLFIIRKTFFKIGFTIFTKDDLNNNNYNKLRRKFDIHLTFLFKTCHF